MSKLFIEDTTLVAIGDAIRGKGGTSDKIAPLDMATAITNLPSGGGGNEPTAEDLTFTGNCSNLFNSGNWNWVIKNYGNRITTKEITDMERMFGSTNIGEIPFKINGKTSGSRPSDNLINCSYAFYYAHLKTFPNIKVSPSDMSYMFANNDFAHLPEGYGAMVDCRYIGEGPVWSGNQNSLLENCNRLREAPYQWYKYGIPDKDETSSYFYYGFNSCYCLDELVNLPNPYHNAEWTSNAFQGAFEKCWHLKDITFAPKMTNGKFNNPKWKSQTIDLSKYAGYSGQWSSLSDYGLPAEKEIKDKASYDAYKNDNDSWTKKMEYSRYNHDSAVRTINSLPDTHFYLESSGGGTNTIKFRGNAGSLTDGGAINTLTEAEIAVAASKGWTVSLV